MANSEFGIPDDVPNYGGYLAVEISGDGGEIWAQEAIELNDYTVSEGNKYELQTYRVACRAGCDGAQITEGLLQFIPEAGFFEDLLSLGSNAYHLACTNAIDVEDELVETGIKKQ